MRLADGVHQVRLEHGTTSGKRVITVDGKEVIQHKLILYEPFTCRVRIRIYCTSKMLPLIAGIPQKLDVFSRGDRRLQH